MNIAAIIIIIVLAIVILVAIWAIVTYNSLVTLRNRVSNGWAQIDVQLKQRADLVPNLVETVKGYAGHESEVFQRVTEARAHTVQAAAQGDAVLRAQAEGELSHALVNLLATAEAYPQLQANQNFLDLQRQLSQLEQKIAYARQFYNDIVLKFNTAIDTVPSNIIAGMFNFQHAAFFEAADQDRDVPQVTFAK